MNCLIIAAGMGSRLSKMGDSKPLVPLNGVPLIERVISTACAAGVNSFFVVVGYHADGVRWTLKQLSMKYNVKITDIENLEWKRPNGISVFKAKEYLKEPFFLTMTDHIYDKEILTRFQREQISMDEVILGVDYKIKNNPFIDIDDVTKVEVENGYIVNIGKEIKKYNAFDTGIFLATPALFDALEKSIAAGDESLSAGIKTLAQSKKARVFDIGDEYWIDVDDDLAFKKAEETIISQEKPYGNRKESS